MDEAQGELPLPFPELAADMPLLPARMVNEYQYCPRLAYLEWVQGEWAESADTVEGRYRHRRVATCLRVTRRQGGGFAPTLRQGIGRPFLPYPARARLGRTRLAPPPPLGCPRQPAEEPVRSDQHEVADVAVGGELLYLVAMPAQDFLDRRRRAVSPAYPDDLRRRAGDDAALMEIRILGDDDEPALFRVAPHRFVQGAIQAR